MPKKETAPVEEAPKPTPEELQAVVDAAALKVAEAKKVLDEASAVHTAASEEHAAAVKATEVVPEYGKHVLVDFGATGDYACWDAPKGWDNDRRLFLQGVNVEHVGDDSNGVWQYRRM